MARDLEFTDALVRSVPCPKFSSQRNSRTKPSTVCSRVAMGIVVSVTQATLAADRGGGTGLGELVVIELVTASAGFRERPAVPRVIAEAAPRASPSEGSTHDQVPDSYGDLH